MIIAGKREVDFMKILRITTLIYLEIYVWQFDLLLWSMTDFYIDFLKCGFLHCFEWVALELQMQVNADKWQQHGSSSTSGHWSFQLPILVSFRCWWKLQCTVDHSRQDWSALTRLGLQDFCAFRISLKASRYRLKHLKTGHLRISLSNFHCRFS